jgi:molecular chaperone GrpE
MMEKKEAAERVEPQEEAREIPIEDASTQASETQALIDRLKRLQAEFENYKKRVARETAEREERATDRLLLDVLPLYDGMQLAFENHSRDEDNAAFVAGVERIFAQFEQILASLGVATIESIGQPFDPALHEALLTLPSDEEKNRIIEEFSPGYVRNGRTLRASKVGVSQGSQSAKEEEA